MVTKNLLQLEKLRQLQEWIDRRSGRWLINHLSWATEHLPDKERLILSIFRKCVIILLMVTRSKLFKNKIISMLEFQQKNKWTIFLDKLTSSDDQNMLTTYLLKIYVQESILKERVFQPFWTPAYKEISEKLLLPIKIDYVDSDLSSLNHWSQKQVEKLPFLTIQTIEHVNKNLPMISYPSSMFFPVDKWEKGVMPTGKIKTIKIKIYPNQNQRQILNRLIDTSRYVYNRTIEYINKKGHRPNFQSLRDLLVTDGTKKNYDDYKTHQNEIDTLRNQCKKIDDEKEKEKIKASIKEKHQQNKNNMKNFKFIKNPLIKEFELFTHKDIRANAVKRVCDAYKTGFSNLKKGNIKFFNMKFKKKSESRQTIELDPCCISMKNGIIKILPGTFKNDSILKISKRNKKKHKNLCIENNVDLQRHKGEYYLYIISKITKVEKEKEFDTVCGVDPGVRTFATVHTNSKTKTTITEYIHRTDLLKKLNKKLVILKEKYHRKKQYNKIEKKKTDIVDSLHWSFINDLLKKNDVIYFGDIKSHDIVKDGKNKTLNRNFNDLKFHVLKERLKYKNSIYKKHLFLIPEHYTTKCCSNCGTINNNVGSNEVFNCLSCGLKTGRDINSSKNIKMKGMMT